MKWRKDKLLSKPDLYRGVGDKCRGNLITVYTVPKPRDHKAGMTSIQALLWNHRKPMCYAKRKTQAGNTCESITDERIGCGRTRSSVETPVMGAEQRTSVI